MRLDGDDRIVVRVPAEQVKNQQGLEHFVSDDTKQLLELYGRSFDHSLSAALRPGYSRDGVASRWSLRRSAPT